jgi:glycine dehydrogenase
MPDTPVSARATLEDLEDHGAFQRRHIGPDAADEAAMLGVLGFGSRAELIDAVVPPAIRRRDAMGIGAPRAEGEALARLRGIAEKNLVFKSYIGQGYYETYTPGVILRNIFQNPAWYTAYTPYQPRSRRDASKRSSISRRWWRTSPGWPSRTPRCWTRRRQRRRR